VGSENVRLLEQRTSTSCHHPRH